MNNQIGRSTRLRYTATGAVAALIAAGAIAGPSVLAATPRAKAHPQSAAASSRRAKTPPSGTGQAGASQPGSSQPFLLAVQRLVNDGTISAAQGRAVDRQILAGQLEPQTLTASGLTQSQIQAVVQALGSAKRALVANAGAQPAPGPNAAPAKAGKAAPPPAADNPFVLAVQRLVDEGTITKTEGQAVDRQVLAGSLDPRTLTSSGFTQAQIQAVVQALANTKRSLR